MSLSSLIVQREIATIRQVEEALARQVIYGGDLATNLLEVARVDEAKLIALLVESSTLVPLPAGVLALPSAEVRGLVPVALALERTLIPIAHEEGRLVVAVAEPLSSDAVEQLAFALGVTVDERLALAIRIREAIGKAYGVDLDRRTQRLLTRLRGETVPVGSMPPPLAHAPTVVAVPQAPSPFGSPAIYLAPQRPTVAGFLGPLETPIVDMAPSPEADSTDDRLTPVHPEPHLHVPTPPAPSPVGDRTSTTPTAEPSAPEGVAPPDTPVGAQTPETALLQRDAQRDTTREMMGMGAAPPPRNKRRRRGPLTFEAAKKELEEAEDRDSLLGLLFDFSRQFFEYTVMFLVHGDIAEGRDAFGAGPARDKVIGIGVPLDLPSALASAKDSRQLILVRPSEGLDEVLLADLQRSKETQLAVVPLVVRTRAVALVLGDCGDAGVERESLDDIARLASIVGLAFEKIIVRRKLSGFVAGNRSGAAGRVDFSGIPTKGGASSRGSEAHPTATEPSPPPEDGSSSPPEAATTTTTVAAPAPSPEVAPTAPPPDGPQPAEAKPSPPPEADDESAYITAKRDARDGTELSANTEPRLPAIVSAYPPPPANVVHVRRPTGPPIPREEPESGGRTPASRVPSHSAPDLDAATLNEADARALLEELSRSSYDDGHDDDPTPSSAAFAVAAHRPPSARVSVAPELPSVVVDLSEELGELVDRLSANGDDDQAEAELLRQGQRAMPVIMSRFPGPLVHNSANRISTNSHSASRISLNRHESGLRASERGPLLRLIVGQRKVALPFVISLLADSDSERRFWATALIGELPYAEAVDPLVDRVFDLEARTRRAARASATALAKHFAQSVVDALGRHAKAQDAEHRLFAIEALGELREPAAVPVLVGSLGDARPEVAEMALGALRLVTRQDFSTDARRWSTWWSASHTRHRVEWLIDALDHDHADIRRAAADELKGTTKENFGYAEDLPPRDRQRAQQRYRDWWVTDGRARFRRR